MLNRAFDAGVPCVWISGDTVYGGVFAPWVLVAKHGRAHVLGVTGGQQLYWPHQRTVAEIANEFPQRAWQRVSCGPGAEGLRVYQWIYQVYGSTEDGWCKGLLVSCRCSSSPPGTTGHAQRSLAVALFDMQQPDALALAVMVSAIKVRCVSTPSAAPRRRRHAAR